jgi:hypothetical protein
MSRPYRKSWAVKRNAIRFAQHWRERWAKDDGTMRSNLERINSGRKKTARERTDRLAKILSTMPATVKSSELREELSKAFQRQGLTLDPQRFNSMRVALWRRKLIEHDAASLSWRILPK